MIDKIETVTMDLSGLKNLEEIKSYIPTQLIKYHPKPQMLTFDFALRGKGDNKSALVSYIDSSLVKEGEKRLKHPLLLFKSVLKKDGEYLIIYQNRILEVRIVKGAIFNSDQHNFSYNYLKTLKSRELTVISDSDKIPEIRAIFPRVIPLEKLYSRCKKNLFIIRKKSPLVPLLTAIFPISILLFLFFQISSEYNSTMAKLESLKREYNSIKLSSTKNSNNEKRYNKLLKELYSIQSQTTVDLYSIFYDLNRYGSNYKIQDINYSNRFLRVNAISKNSINLIDNLNRSQIFNFTQNSTTTTEDFEEVHFSGEIICP